MEQRFKKSGSGIDLWIHCRMRQLYILITVCILMGCGEARYPQVLIEADSLADLKPYQAKMLLQNVEKQMEAEPEHVQMFYQLLRIKANDKSMEPHLSDSTILRLVDYYERSRDKKLLKQAYYYAARTYISMKDATLAEEYFEKALKTGDTISNSQIYWWLGDLYRKQGLYDLAIEKLHRAYLGEQQEDSVEQLIDLFSLGRTYREMERYDSCIHYMQETFILASALKDSSMMRTTASAIADVAVRYGQYDYARRILGHRLAGAMATNDVDLLTSAASLYAKTGMEDSAKLLYRRMLEQSLPNKTKRDVYRSLLSLNLKQRNIGEAYDNLLYYEHFDDTVRHDDISEQLVKMNSVYDYRIREKQAEQLRAENERKQMWIGGIAALLIVVLISSLWYISYSHQRQTILRFKIQKKDELIAHYQSKTKQEKESTQTSIEQTGIYRYIQQAILDKRHLTNEEWQLLDKTVNQIFKGFSARLQELCRISQHDYHICLLIKVGMLPMNIATLTDHSPEAISSTRRRLYQRAFGQKGTPKDWDSLILSL